MSKPDPLKQGDLIKKIAESFIESRLSVSEAFSIAASVVLGESGGETTHAVGFRMERSELVDECTEEDRVCKRQHRR